MITASNAHIVALDNVSNIRPMLSDALCRLATGGGFSTRELYTDGEEVIFEAMRPVVLTGIEEVATRGDLVDRSVVITLPSITEDARREERGFWAAFETARPRILGALLDAVVIALRDREHVQLRGRPRMADFAAVAAAAAPALGWTSDAFLTAYALNRRASRTSAVEASIVGMTVMRFIEERDSWAGTADELLAALRDAAGEQVTRMKGWPTTPRALSGELRRIGPALESVGVVATFDMRVGKKRTRVLQLERAAETPSAASNRPRERGFESDEADGSRLTADEGRSNRPPQPSASGQITDSGAASADGADAADGRGPSLSGPSCSSCGLVLVPEPGELCEGCLSAAFDQDRQATGPEQRAVEVPL